MRDEDPALVVFGIIGLLVTIVAALLLLMFAVKGIAYTVRGDQCPALVEKTP